MDRTATQCHDLFIIFWAIYKAFANNYDLYRTLRFLKKSRRPRSRATRTATVSRALKSLNSDGAMLNIQNMHGALDNLSVYGHMNFTDNDARLIKSKFGSRMRHERNVVSYLSGILVMMGLIGTFWGFWTPSTMSGRPCRRFPIPSMLRPNQVAATIWALLYKNCRAA